jgi:hypothetical protein
MYIIKRKSITIIFCTIFTFICATLNKIYCAKLEEWVYAVAKAKQSEDDLLQELFHLFEIDERIYKWAENPNYAIDRTDVLAIRHLISTYGMKVRDQRWFLNTIRELVIQISSNY